MIDPEVLQRELYAACRQRGKNVEFVQTGNVVGDGFVMHISPGLNGAVYVTSKELKNSSMGVNDLLSAKLAEAGLDQ